MPPFAEGSANNYPCGCVATAAAQILRYFQWPRTAVGTASFRITVNGVPQIKSLRGGDGAGGPYDWPNMVLDPNALTGTPQRQAIGALTYDVGVASEMDYAQGGSGASLSLTRSALTGTFGYSNAIYGFSYPNTIPGDSLISILNPDLDAGLPVLLGIYGTSSGHAVVADGYGYDTGTLYHHLNLGWGGAQGSNAWYNLPTIDAGGYSFSLVGDCIYNIYTSGSGEIISGRVLDASGKPVSGAAVTATRSGGAVYTAATNSQGIYALAQVPSSSSYTVSAALPGLVSRRRVVATGLSQNRSTPGNLWGVDFTLRKPLKISPVLKLLLED